MNSGSTVKFDVGGKIYKVYRSLIEQYPDSLLAKVVGVQNDEKDDNNDIKSDSDDAIFFDRDSERFRYIVDYMRDGKVDVPFGETTKDALMAEFSFFGFMDVDPSKVNISVPIFDTIKQVKFFSLKVQAKKEEFLKAQKEFNGIQRNYIESELAHFCLMKHIKEEKVASDKVTSLSLKKDEFKTEFECPAASYEGTYDGICKEFGVRAIGVGIDKHNAVTICWKMCVETTNNNKRQKISPDNSQSR